jgi:hypothetical protein
LKNEKCKLIRAMKSVLAHSNLQFSIFILQCGW